MKDCAWDRLGRRKMTNMSFFNVFKAPSCAIVNAASQSNTTGIENDDNDMFVIFCLPKRSHNPSLVPISVYRTDRRVNSFGVRDGGRGWGN